MTHELENFILNYNTKSNLDQICFNYFENDKGGYYDLNDIFREDVSCRIRALKYEVSVELLRDLFIAHCETSAKALGCYRYLGELGQALIEKSKTKYVLDYLHYSTCSFDSRMASSMVKWEEELVIEIRTFLEEEREKQTDLYLLKDIDFGLNHRFSEGWIKSLKLKKQLSVYKKRNKRKKKN